MADIPRILGDRYEVGDLIGRGGMAQVHLGYDTRLSRAVAIKVLRTDHATDPTFIARFRRRSARRAPLGFVFFGERRWSRLRAAQCTSLYAISCKVWAQQRLLMRRFD